MNNRIRRPRLLIALLLTLSASASVTAGESGIRFSVINTSGITTIDGLTYKGGDWFSTARLNHAAFLVEHPKGSFLFDSGLGRNIDAQYEKDMPLWMRPNFRYDTPTPVRDQLEQSGQPLPDRIILSHAHWDHGSGVPDFPGAEVWITPQEYGFIAEAASGPVMRSQFTDPEPRWHHYELDKKDWRGFEKSLDLFGDGSAVLLGQSGHTPGSVALYLRTASGREYLLCGDTIWRAKALKETAPKSMLASWIVDNDGHATLERVEQLAKFSRDYPDVIIVPAHDAEIHDLLGYFPRWVE